MGERTRPRVGILWRGSAYDPERWPHFAELQALWQCTDFEFWNLQYNDAANADVSSRLRHAGEVLQTQEFAEYCELINNLDLIISPDTMAAHLAGSLGKPISMMPTGDE